MLHAYNRHRYLEIAGRYKEIFEPEMTVEHPIYHFNVFGMNVTLDGREEVESVYGEWTLEPSASSTAAVTSGSRLATT